MIDLIKAALKGGFKTSEFWLAVLAVITPMLDGWFNHLYAAITNAEAHATNPLIMVALAGAAAFVSAAYSIGRSLIKKQSVAAAPALGGYVTPSGNVATVSATPIPRPPLSPANTPPTLGAP